MEKKNVLWTFDKSRNWRNRSAPESAATRVSEVDLPV